MDEIAENNQELVITKNHKPVAKLVPFKNKPKTLFGVDKGNVRVLGDITSPVDVDWDAETGRGWDELL